MSRIPIIDLFAGPGGLGEGFSSVMNKDGEPVFEIKLSIEKDINAHKTLRLRSFFRQFRNCEVPELYYQYIKENNPKNKEILFNELKERYCKEWGKAENEAWHFELPYPEEFDKNGKKKGGYKQKEIIKRNHNIDERITAALPKGREFLLIGGPPCQAYSLVGRARNQGISNGDHRVHLYKEYLRIIAKHHPAIFVMENVKGLLSANIEGVKVFDLIKQDLHNPNNVFPDCGSPKYRVFSFVKPPDKYDEDGFPVYDNNKDFLIRAEKYAVPQRRHRVILLGVREDINIDLESFGSLIFQEAETTLQNVIGELPAIRSGISREVIGTNEKGKHIYKSIKNTYDNWQHSVLNYSKMLAPALQKNMPNILNEDYQGANFVRCELNEDDNPLYKHWYNDNRLHGVLNHESRTHLKEDLGRYLFSSLYLGTNGEFPRLKDYPNWLLPKHKNAKKGDKFADRFRTQKPNQAATTVTSHISKDGHYFIHYDATQCRSLTVREAARIQTFPDNYYFCGSRTHQYHQVGNAVPPYLAYQLAQIVYSIFNDKP